MDTKILIALAIFVTVYGFLIWDRFDRAIVSILGAGVLLFLGIISQEEAIEGIDFNTLGLLVGMMAIVSICQKTGMFQYLAIKSAKFARGEPVLILIYLAVVTAVLSALLDNVTTVLLIAPITLLITDELKVSPYPFLFSQILASNIGGAATLIGDPPNIMIGSSQKFTFMDFIVNVAPIMPPILIVTLLILKMVYGKELVTSEELKAKIMEFREEEAIEDPVLLKKSLIVLSAVIVGFLIHGLLHVEPATVALTGAAVLMLISGEDIHHTMGRVEWSTIFFFLGLFVLVHGLVEVGLISMIAEEILALTDGDVATTAYLTLWFSGILSAFVDNIPFVATMIPLIEHMETYIGSKELVMPVWWALSIGACLGGNGSLIGASANVIIAGFAARSGYPIGFVRFMKVGLPLTILSLLISHVYLYLRYLS